MSGSLRSDSNGWANKYSSIIQTVAVVAAFTGGFWAGVINPIAVHVDRIETEAIKIREHEAYQRRIDERLRIMEDQIIRDEGLSVSKDAYTLRAIAEDARFTRLQSDLKDLRDVIGGAYSIKDAIAQVQRRLDDVQNKILSPSWSEKKGPQ